MSQLCIKIVSLRCTNNMYLTKQASHLPSTAAKPWPVHLIFASKQCHAALLSACNSSSSRQVLLDSDALGRKYRSSRQRAPVKSQGLSRSHIACTHVKLLPLLGWIEIVMDGLDGKSSSVSSSSVETTLVASSVGRSLLSPIF